MGQINIIIPDYVYGAVILLSTLCVYDKQVQAFIALGPVATAGHIQGFAKYLSDAVVEEKVSINVTIVIYLILIQQLI